MDQYRKNESRRVLELLHRASSMQAAASECIAQLNDLLQPESRPRYRPSRFAGTYQSQAPIIDSDKLSVAWNGATCFLGDTLPFRLLERLNRRPGYYIPPEDLLQDVWKCRFKSPETIRSTVRRLKQLLRVAGMQALSRAIRCDGGRYALVINGQS